jgi:hypothetical protein
MFVHGVAPLLLWLTQVADQISDEGITNPDANEMRQHDDKRRDSKVFYNYSQWRDFLRSCQKVAKHGNYYRPPH